MFTFGVMYLHALDTIGLDHRLVKYSILTHYVQLEQQKILRPSLGFAKRHGRRLSDVILLK